MRHSRRCGCVLKNGLPCEWIIRFSQAIRTEHDRCCVIHGLRCVCVFLCSRECATLYGFSLHGRLSLFKNTSGHRLQMITSPMTVLRRNSRDTHFTATCINATRIKYAHAGFIVIRCACSGVLSRFGLAAHFSVPPWKSGNVGTTF